MKKEKSRATVKKYVRDVEAFFACNSVGYGVYDIPPKPFLADYGENGSAKPLSVSLAADSSPKGEPVSRSNIWREMKAICKAANVNPSKVFPHNLRHLFARVFYAIEKDIAKLADILGHSSINTTRIYIVSTGDEHRRRMEKMKLVI